MKNKWELAASLATINCLETETKKKKKEALTQEMKELAPKARTKLQENNGDVTKLWKKEIASLLLVDHNIEIDPDKAKKNELTKLWEDNTCGETSEN